MFQLDWAQEGLWKEERPSDGAFKSKLEPAKVQDTLLLHWEEHCLECAIPYCYKQCPLYLGRIDKKCRNFVYGIYPNRGFRGLLNFGADIRFRRWGKLQTEVYGKRLSPLQHQVLQGINNSVTGMVNIVSDVLQPVSPRRRLNSAWAYLREKLFERTRPTNSDAKDFFDEFVMEVFLPEGERPFSLLLEYFEGKEVRFRHAFDIKPGQNFYALPAEQLSLAPKGRLTIYPEGNAEPRVIFTWLDFVRYAPPYRGVGTAAVRPASKVKCVAWDLDNTLWEGVLSEDGKEGLRPRTAALDVIRKLDERGIIQTIASKNTFSEAWAVIERLGLQGYFLYPAINWGSKSENLRGIAKRLNINLDTFALIDDSPFERAEVQSALPQVRVYSAGQIPELLGYDEFNVPVTELSKVRRASYLAEIKREEVRGSFPGDYESFLRSCEMRLRLFVPREERHTSRCLELIQRSNQLNLSARRYTAEELNQLLSNPHLLNVALECRDRFGDYGIVGFVSVEETEEVPILRDLVISCRVAQKGVEHTFLRWLIKREAERGKTSLQIEALQTELNGPLFQVFKDMSFRLLKKDGQHVLMELPFDKLAGVKDVMELEVDVT